MTRWVWVLAGLMGWTACACSGDDPDEPGQTPEQRRQQVQQCIVTRVPPPAGSTEARWSVSGYALVSAYRSCQAKQEDATSEDFRDVLRGLAEPEEDPSRVKLTQPTGSAP
ncbi:hypothetical protein [Myxococcus sp. CA040A]|uniref:hypothetical protein n=1 Tax=Myxococcus sp. CA040A TaxID=2741738 RepID=UPI00157A7904|nr:hypothetical protein [Myxococcus sp. CA040A]NTX04434.1 hypothetical protein [Myxococcus sp. CA040A]